jgi:hypothetical protein
VIYRAIYDRLHYEGFSGERADGYRGNVRSTIKRIRQKFLAIDPTFAEIENFTSFGPLGQTIRVSRTGYCIVQPASAWQR